MVAKLTLKSFKNAIPYNNIKTEINRSNEIFFDKTNKLIKENINLTNTIYDKMEKGVKINSINDFKNSDSGKNYLNTVVKLFGFDNKENNSKINFREINNHNYSPKNSDSDESQMDIDVYKNDN